MYITPNHGKNYATTRHVMARTVTVAAGTAFSFDVSTSEQAAVNNTVSQTLSDDIDRPASRLSSILDCVHR